jgi:hypothetical protein
MDVKYIKNPLFKVHTVSDWIEGSKERPVPKYLFGEFWLEGEVAILFADTGKGKSILAVQIAESLTRGTSIEPFKNTAEPQQVLYLDFELTAKQFEMRYAEDREDGEEDKLSNHYEFSPNLIRAEAAIMLDVFPRPKYQTFDEYLTDMMVQLIRQSDAKILIVDNLTYLRQQNERTYEAVRLMRALKEIRNEFGLSILVLAHTPKRAVTSPLTVNDLQGSKVLSNFADNIFAIGAATAESDVRYLKHIKLRSAEMQYDTLNVPVFRLAKRDGNFLAFNFLKIEDERLLLGGRAGTYDPNMMERIRNAVAQGMSQRTIATFLGVSKTTVNRYMRLAQRTADSGQRTVNSEQLAVNNSLTTDNRLTTTDDLDDDCDCHECISGNPDQCLETNWSQQCCDGTDPECCWTEESSQSSESIESRESIGSSESLESAVGGQNAVPAKYANEGEKGADHGTPHSPDSMDPVVSRVFHGPKRRRLQDLERRVNDLGKEFFVETTNPQTGKPIIWYHVDNKRNVHRWIRDDFGSTGKIVAKAPFIE